MGLKQGIWRPWICLGALLGSQLVVFVVVAITLVLSRSFRYWIGTSLGHFSIFTLGLLAALLVALMFSRPKSVSNFLDIFELKSIRGSISCSAIIVGLILGCIGVFAAQTLPAGLSEKAWVTRAFIYQVGLAKYLPIIALLADPFCEEIFIRGFLYRAFRKSYGVYLSIFMIVLVAMLTHPVMRASVWVFLVLSTLQVILCLILEKTRNLSNCIICHFAYNATLVCASLMGTFRWH
jgi:membrane protease YdiL (CAAX protease family)